MDGIWVNQIYTKYMNSIYLHIAIKMDGTWVNEIYTNMSMAKYEQQ